MATETERERIKRDFNAHMAKKIEEYRIANGLSKDEMQQLTQGLLLKPSEPQP